jgi:hypothetical protein
MLDHANQAQRVSCVDGLNSAPIDRDASALRSRWIDLTQALVSRAARTHAFM